MSKKQSKLKLNRMVVDLSPEVLERKKVKIPLPELLCNDGEKGVNELVFNVELECGAYEFHFQHGVTRNEVDRVSSQAYIVYLDDREIGFGAAPAIDFTEEERDIRSDYHCRFLCLEAGRHTITIKVIHPWNDFSPNQPFPLYAIDLRPYEVKRRRATVSAEFPGWVLLDAWGWHLPLTYQRRELDTDATLSLSDPEEAPSMSYFEQQATDESWRWGANVQEFFVQVDRRKGSGWAVPWDKDDPIPGAEHYLCNPIKGWGKEEFVQLCRYAHYRGMLFHWYGHYTATLEPDTPAEVYDPWLFNLVQKTGRDYANPLTCGWEGAIDGFTSETCDYSRSAFFVEVVKRFWMYNPGLYHIENRGPNWDRPMTACAPSFMIAQACNHMHWNGYDDKDPIVAYDRKVEHGGLGKNFFLYQADCRMYSPNFFGGNTRPDYVLKQCNDFFRGRAEHPDDTVETAIWWLNESRVTCPDELRRYVYGITQDPIKCAVTCNLGTTGVGGTMDRWHRTDFAEFDGNPRYQTRPRSEFFHDTSIIQNNFFRAYFHKNIDGGVLMCDLEGLAHYDSNSLTVPISRDFLSTEVEGVGRLVRTSHFVEPAGYKAVYEEDASIHCGLVQEKRRIIIHNDTPSFSVLIERTSELHEVGTRIGLEEYDGLKVDGKIYKEATSLNYPKVLEFSDSRGILPHLHVFIQQPGNIQEVEWKPSNALILHSRDVTEETIKLVFAVLDDEIPKDIKLSDYAQAIEEDELEITLGDEGIAEVANKYPFPLVKVLKITDPDGSPYQVCENGWWMFRGAQPSLEYPDCDYLKVHLSANGSVKVRRYGFVDGVVKNGWGCQYTTAIGEVKAGKERGRRGAEEQGSKAAEERTDGCVVKVFNVTPLVFAPRVQFAGKIASAKLDGKPWHYFDEDLVFLPNRPGIYRLEVEYGEPATPHLTRSYGLLESSCWDGKTLTLEFGLPPWANKLYPGLKLTGVIKTEEREVRSVKEAAVVYQTERGIVVEYPPGKVAVELA